MDEINDSSGSPDDPMDEINKWLNSIHGQPNNPEEIKNNLSHFTEMIGSMVNLMYQTDSKQTEQEILTIAKKDVNLNLPALPAFEIDNEVYESRGKLKKSTSLAITDSAIQLLTRENWLSLTLPNWLKFTKPLQDTFKSQLDNLGKDLPGNIMPMFGISTGNFSSTFTQPNAGGNAQKGSMGDISNAIFSFELAQSLNTAAQNFLGVSDIGLPLIDKFGGIVPANAVKYADEISVPYSELMRYLIARELLSKTLFENAPWLSISILTLIRNYTRHLKLQNSIQNFTDMAGGDFQSMLSEGLSKMDIKETSGLNDPAVTEIMDRLGWLLALIEGWVNSVAYSALKDSSPNAGILFETFRKKRIEITATENTLFNLLGIRIAPAMIGSAHRFWDLAALKLGSEKRDDMILDQQALPGIEFIDAIEAFFDDDLPQVKGNSIDWNSELKDLLSGGDGNE